MASKQGLRICELLSQSNLSFRQLRLSLAHQAWLGRNIDPANVMKVVQKLGGLCAEQVLYLIELAQGGRERQVRRRESDKIETWHGLQLELQEMMSAAPMYA